MSDSRRGVKGVLKALWPLFLILLIFGGATIGFLFGREEQMKEKQREATIKSSSQVHRAPDGSTEVILDVKSVQAAGIETRRYSRASSEIPREAVVRSDAQTWVYLETAPGKFSRVGVGPVGEPFSFWRLTRRNLPTEIRVVTVGAQLLLSEESKSSIKVGD